MEVSVVSLFWFIGELDFDDKFDSDARSVPTGSSPPSATTGMN